MSLNNLPLLPALRYSILAPQCSQLHQRQALPGPTLMLAPSLPARNITIPAVQLLCQGVAAPLRTAVANHTTNVVKVLIKHWGKQ